MLTSNSFLVFHLRNLRFTLFPEPQRGWSRTLLFGGLTQNSFGSGRQLPSSSQGQSGLWMLWYS